MILTAIHGFCMALADSVPGVSGGTIAFILGFYDRFLDALHSLFGRDAGLRKAAVLYLLKLGLGWAVGMGACVLALSKLFAAHIYFMSSLFLGLTLASFPFVIRAEKKALRGQERYAPFAVFGVLLVVLLTLVRSNTAAVSIRFAGAPLWMLGYIFLSGAVAITAMVLPGISGSTILLIAGVYLPAIQAIRAFLGLDFSVLPGAHRAWARRSRGHRAFHSRDSRGAQKIPAADGLADSGSDGGLLVRDHHGPCVVGHSASACGAAKLRFCRLRAWGRDLAWARGASQMGGAADCLQNDGKKEGGNMNFDWTILHWIQNMLVCPAMDFLMPKITLLGNGGAVWILSAIGLLATKKYRKYGAFLLAGLAVGVLTGNLTLKPLIARPRPCWLDSSVQLLIANPTDYSFPSGHTLSSVIGATVLTKANRKFGLAAIPLAALIAFSRLYLYVHFPTDILGAAVLGVGIGLVTCTIGDRVRTALAKKGIFLHAR